MTPPAATNAAAPAAVRSEANRDDDDLDDDDDERASMLLRPGVIAAAIGGALLLVAVLAFAVVSRGSFGGGDNGLALADRWLRVGEDINTGVTVYDGEMPPDIADILNPGTDAQSPDRATLPVHPDAKLLGSYHLRRGDGANLVWLMYDVEGSLADVAKTLTEQLNRTPWQVMGGQGNEALNVVRFQNTLSGDLEGSAVVQEMPSTDDFKLTVARGGGDTTLTVRRTAPVPLLGATLADDLTVSRIEAGPARDAGLRNGDRVTKVDGTDVSSRAAFDTAMHGLIEKGTRRVSVTYVLQVAPAEEPAASTFVPPATPLALPRDFPATQAWQGLTLTDYAWTTQQGGRGFQAQFVTKEPSAAVAQRVRTGLTGAGWQITDDQAVGFATQLEIVNASAGFVGQVQIDTYDADEDYVQVVVQMQTGTPEAPGASTVPGGPTATPTATGTATP